MKLLFGYYHSRLGSQSVDEITIQLKGPAVPLRTSLESSPETVQEFEAASQERYLEGLELMLANQCGAGVYLMGYAAEIVLKEAYFRLIGSGLTDRVGTLLPPARTWGRANLPQPISDDESYHSLRFWAALLCARRTGLGKPFPPAFESELLRTSSRLYVAWWVEMRYHVLSQASLGDARDVYNDVTWIISNRLQLWS